MLYDNVQTVSDSLTDGNNSIAQNTKKSRRGKRRRLGVRQDLTSQDLRVIYTKH